MRKGRPRQGEPWRLGWAGRVASPQDFIVIIHKILIVLIALTMVMTRYLMDQKSTSRKDRRLVQAWGQDEGRRGFPGPAMSCWDLVDFSPWKSRIPKILYEYDASPAFWGYRQVLWDVCLAAPLDLGQGAGWREKVWRWGELCWITVGLRHIRRNPSPQDLLSKIALFEISPGRPVPWRRLASDKAGEHQGVLQGAAGDLYHAYSGYDDHGDLKSFWK